MVDEYENLDIICNARNDSVIYDLAPPKKRKKEDALKTWETAVYKDDFSFSEEKIGDYYIGVRRVLSNIFGEDEVLAFCYFYRKYRQWRKAFLQYSFSGTAHHVLCMAGKSSFQSDRQWTNEIYSIVPLWIPLESRSKLLRTENILVIMQLYDTKQKRNWDAKVNLIHHLLLWYQDVSLKEYQDKSVQEFRFVLSSQIRGNRYFMPFREKYRKLYKINPIHQYLKGCFSNKGTIFKSCKVV